MGRPVPRVRAAHDPGYPLQSLRRTDSGIGNAHTHSTAHADLAPRLAPRQREIPFPMLTGEL